jgi:hypothetical protein
LKSESLAEIEKGLELVNGNVKLLDNLLLQCDSMGQLKGLLARVENPAELERLINEAGSGPELEKLLNEFPKRSAAELESSTVKSLKDELKVKEEGGGGEVVEGGASKHPGKYSNKKLVDAENNLVAKTKAKDGHDVGVDVNGEPVLCTHCDLLRKTFSKELQKSESLTQWADRIDKYNNVEKQVQEYKKLEEQLSNLQKSGGKAKIEVGLSSFETAENFGIQTYDGLRALLGTGSGYQVHHLIEQRFASLFTKSTGEWESIVLSAEEHNIFTRKWQEYIPYKNSPSPLNTLTATIVDVESAAKKIYKDYPEILKALGL